MFFMMSIVNEIAIILYLVEILEFMLSSICHSMPSPYDRKSKESY